MRSTITITNTPYSGPGKLLTLVGYSSVLTYDSLKPGDLYQSWDLHCHNWPTHDRAPSLSVCYVGAIKRECCQMVMLLGSVCWFKENRYIPTKCTLFQIMHRITAKILIQYHDNNIWNWMCIKNLSYIIENYHQ